MRKLAFSSSATLGGMLRERALGPQGEDVRLLYADGPRLPWPRQPEGDDRAIVLSYAEVYELACRAASCFRRLGVKPHDRILLFLSTGHAFLAAFYGCQMIGAVAVPVAPPRNLSEIEGHLTRVARICEPALSVVGSRFMPLFRLARTRARESLKRVVQDVELLADEPTVTEPYSAEPTDTALLQFTSGSTGSPKGVTISHANLFANIRAIGVASGFQDGDVALCWLPLFHDMGLIGHMLNTALWRVGLVLMPPEVFIAHPSRWLKALSSYGVAHSTAPNFAYLLCVRKISEREIEGVDLSRWRLAYCGSEPIHPETIRRFTERFASKGFKATTFFPVYGLAEFTLAASFPPPAALPRYDRVEREPFESDGIARAGGSSATRDADTMEWVSVGRAVPGHALRVVDSSGAPAGERRVGEIELSGPSMMVGYYRDAEATARVIRDGWLRTGDLGYVADGDLFVTGRSKDLIIKAGRNIYPQDVEHAASSVAGVRAGCCAAFAVTNEERGMEELVLVCETKVEDRQKRVRLGEEIRAKVRDEIAAAPDMIRLVEPGTVLKTSSGKIRRQEMRDRYLRGQLEPDRPSLLRRVRLSVGVVREQVYSAISRRKHL